MNEDLNINTEGAVDWIAFAWEKLLDLLPNVLAALVTLIIGFWIVKILMKAIGKAFTKREMDASLASFLITLLKAILRILIIVTAIGMVGIEVTSFVAILGAASLAIGLALQGTLQNFAGGVIILLIKPFKVGQFVTIKGYDGVVKQIQIFHTILKTLDNKTIIIPNGELANTSLTNYSLEPRRRMDWTFGVAYGSDLDKAKAVLTKLVEEDDRLLKDPEPFVGVSALNDSSVDFVVRAWAEMDNYWPAYHDMFTKVYKTFEAENLNIPYPTMTVHVEKAG